MEFVMSVIALIGKLLDLVRTAARPRADERAPKPVPVPVRSRDPRRRR